MRRPRLTIKTLMLVVLAVAVTAWAVRLAGNAEDWAIAFELGARPIGVSLIFAASIVLGAFVASSLAEGWEWPDDSRPTPPGPGGPRP